LITVTDDENPSITCSPDQTQTADAGVCNAVVTVLSPVTNDNCGVSTTINDFNGTSNASGTYPVGTTPVVWTVTDVNGNTNTCTQLITVTDDENPVITCQDITVNPSAGNPVTVLPGMVTLTASDNCSIVDTVVTPNVFSCAQDGQIIPIDIALTDASGNISHCFANVTVTGVGCVLNNPPVAVCQNITVNADGSCEGTAVASDFDGGSSDPDLDPITFSVSTSGPYPLGITKVTLTVRDGSLTDTCTATITVLDVTAPSITCPGNIIQSNDVGFCSASIVTPDPVFGDNCGVTVLAWGMTGATTGNSSPVGINLLGTANFKVGVTNVGYVVTDASGNTSVCTLTVTINDTENPTIT
jgi:hypothetical protein